MVRVVALVTLSGLSYLKITLYVESGLEGSGYRLKASSENSLEMYRNSRDNWEGPGTKAVTIEFRRREWIHKLKFRRWNSQHWLIKE